MESILITGGAGYIGIHTSLTFLEKGFNVVLIDSFSNSSKKSIERLYKISTLTKSFSFSQITFFEGDVRDIKFLRAIFKKLFISGNPIKAVMHFAGLKSVAESISFPKKYWDVNVNGTSNLLKVMSENKCNTFVFSSSATVYSPVEKSPLYENYGVNPIDPYGKTKLAAENILNDLYLSSPNKWKIAILRYFNPIGAHESGLLGENPKSEASNIPVAQNFL